MNTDGDLRVFHVRWKQVTQSVFTFGSLAVVVATVGILLVRGFNSGFSYQVVFQHLSPLDVCGLMLLGIAIILLAAFLAGLLFKRAVVEIRSDSITGMNHSGFKRKCIPFADIEELIPFRQNGIEGIVVKSGSHGKVFISKSTEDIEELAAILDAQLPNMVDGFDVLDRSS